MKRLLSVLALLLFPTLSWAQAASAFSPLNLTPPNSDLSFNYLSNIFGLVDGVLAGTGSQILGALFGVFNSAVLVLGGIVILYTLFVSTISTAHEGEVLGKRWSSIWIPLRSVAGIALLIPKASGYSFIQIFMMWVVVQGIGAADSIWNASLDYLTRGGVIIQQNVSANSPQMRDMINKSAVLLRSLTCTYMLQKQFELYQQSNGGSAPPNFYQGIMAKFTGMTSGTMTLSLPASGYKGTDGVCGSITWSSVTLPPSMTNSDGTVKQAYVNIQKSIEQSRTLAVQQLITQLYPTAMNIANNFLVPKTATTGPIPLGRTLEGSDPVIWGSGTVSAPGPFLVQGTILSDTAASYYGMMAPTLNLISNNAAFTQDWMTKAREDGWILAGKFYFSLVAMNDSVKSFTERSAPAFNPPSSNFTTVPNVYNSLGGKNSPYVTNLNTLINTEGATENTTVADNSPFITGATSYGGSLDYGALEVQKGYNASIPKAARSAMSVFFSGLNDIIGGFFDLQHAQNTNANPILSLATIGSGFVNLCIMTFIYFAIAILVGGLALGFAWGFAFAAAIVGFAVAIMGLITPILITLMIAGFVMCLYIPIIPFIIFTFGAIGWFIAVVEAIIAAPLVALGIAHPEGQEILGKAEPAVILLVNVFLRPTLMIFGMLVGMQICYVSIWLLNQGFMDAYRDSAGRAATGVTEIFVPLAGIILYVIIVQQVVQKSFSLIHIIPDEVLKWIGGNIRGMGGEAEAIQAIGGKFQGVAQQMGETTGKLGDSAVAGASMIGSGKWSDMAMGGGGAKGTPKMPPGASSATGSGGTSATGGAAAGGEAGAAASGGAAAGGTEAMVVAAT